MRTKDTVHCDALARDLAMRVGATVRRWWLDPKNSQRFHVEAMRTFVGARPVVVQFTAMLDAARPPQLRGQPQMRVITETLAPAVALPSSNGASSAVTRRSRTSQRSRPARSRARTGVRRTATARPRTTTTRTRRTKRAQSQPRSRR